MMFDFWFGNLQESPGHCLQRFPDVNRPVGDRHQGRMDWIYYCTLKKTQSLNSDSAPKEGFFKSVFSSSAQTNGSLTLVAAPKATWLCLSALNESLCGYKSVFVLINAAVCVGF